MKEPKKTVNQVKLELRLQCPDLVKMQLTAASPLSNLDLEKEQLTAASLLSNIDLEKMQLTAASPLSNLKKKTSIKALAIILLTKWISSQKASNKNS